MLCIEHWDPDALHTPRRMQRKAEGTGSEFTWTLEIGAVIGRGSPKEGQSDPVVDHRADCLSQE